MTGATNAMHAAILPPCLLAIILALHGFSANGSEQQAEPLGGTQLTPMGAERAGNDDGTIPQWSGGITQALPGYRLGAHHPDPYPDDPILFKITADNLDEHADKLSEGQRALLQLYPDSWYLNVYRSRRSASYPQFVYDAFKENASRAELITDGLGGVRNADITSSFPLPQQGVEVVWNHTLRWRGIHSDRINGQAAVTRNLALYRTIFLQEEIASPYGRLGKDAFEQQHPNIAFAVKQKILAPGSEVGFGQLSLHPIDYTVNQQQSWMYSPNLRRVMRNPRAGFDNPAPNTDGLRLHDEADMFNGSPALFEWKLLGKREIYIPYNSYRLHSGDIAYADILHKGHINPELARYELHRVWVVEGTVRSQGRGHIYSRRVFYIDEDTWQLAVADNYDKDGELWRVAEGHAVNYYEVPVPWYTLEVFHDLKQRRYVANGLDNGFRAIEFTNSINPNKFSPLALEFYAR
jgi:hypothetical protein